MSEGNLNSQLQAYKEVYAGGTFQSTHQSLVKAVQNLRTDFHKKYKATMSVASVMHGYIDFTYFYLQTEYLKKKKLKLAIVLNHQEVQFELWLLGQTKDVQRDYWEKLKSTKWVTNEEMPEYSIFEVVLLSSPDFDNSTSLMESIHSAFNSVAAEINNMLDGYE